MIKSSVYFVWTLCLLTVVDRHRSNFFVSGELETYTKDFKSVPTTVKTYENDTVLLPCYLENAGTEYHVRWIKDGNLLVDSSDNEAFPPERVRLYSNHSLQVTRLQPSDTGEYVCEVIRAKPWSPIRQVHAIEVQYPPSVSPIPDIGIVEVRLGEEVDIACRVTGTPQPIITWLNKGQALELIDNRSRLKFKATNRHLAGNYECLANNGVGEMARASIQVVIMHPPEVESDTQWVHTSIGLRSQLQCRVTASPAAKVHWFHGHNPVALGSRIVNLMKGDAHVLMFRNVHTSDLGSYTCKAENRIGMTEVRMHLSGVANIAIFKSDLAKNHPTQTTFTLIWEVDSYSPIIEYNLWFRPYKPKPPQREGVFIKEKDDTWTKLTIPGEHNDGPMHTASYILGGLTPSTVYEALIVTRNRFGWSKPSSILHFATSSAVMDYPRATEKTSYYPNLEDTYTDNHLVKNASSTYSTLYNDLENAIQLESSSKNNGHALKLSINSFLTIFLLIVIKNIL